MRWFLPVLAVFLCLSPSPASLAEPDPYDMNLDELIQLKSEINLAAWESREWAEVTIPAGLYQVGVDIPAGQWSIRATVGKTVPISYGKELSPDGIHIDSDSDGYLSKTLFCPTHGLYNASTSSLTQVDLTLEDGYYFRIGRNAALFSPYDPNDTFSLFRQSPDLLDFNYTDVAHYPEDFYLRPCILAGYVLAAQKTDTGDVVAALATSRAYGERQSPLVLYIPVENMPSFGVYTDDTIEAACVMLGEYILETDDQGGSSFPLAYVSAVKLIQ